MSCLKSVILLFIVLFSASKSLAEVEKLVLVEEFTKALLLRPLPDQNVLAHFHFQSSALPTRTYGRHHYLFPKSFYQLVHKFQIKEMELSFTQGRWNYECWGRFEPISSNNSKPPGVELWADFDVTRDQVDDSWKNLTLLCLNQLLGAFNYLLCTSVELSIIFRDKAGLSSLMDRSSIYKGYYHSQRMHLKSDEFDASKMSNGIVLEQTLTVVLQPNTFFDKISQPSLVFELII